MSKIEVGFWIGVGYFISILFVIGGLIAAIPTYGGGLILSIIGFILIWMLRRSAGQERMEKSLKEINESLTLSNFPRLF